MDDCNELKKSVAEVEAGVTKTLATDLLANCIENAVRIGSRKRGWLRCKEMAQGSREDMEAIWKVSALWTVHCDEISTHFDRRGKSEQESQEELRMLLDDHSARSS